MSITLNSGKGSNGSAKSTAKLASAVAGFVETRGGVLVPAHLAPSVGRREAAVLNADGEAVTPLASLPGEAFPEPWSAPDAPVAIAPPRNGGGSFQPAGVGSPAAPTSPSGVVIRAGEVVSAARPEGVTPYPVDDYPLPRAAPKPSPVPATAEPVSVRRVRQYRLKFAQDAGGGGVVTVLDHLGRVVTAYVVPSRRQRRLRRIRAVVQLVVVILLGLTAIGLAIELVGLGPALARAAGV